MSILYGCEVTFGSPIYDATYQLRNDVLRKPLKLQFKLKDIKEEYLQHHLVVMDKRTDQLTGCLVMKHLDDHTVKMRQVAIDPVFQGKGYGYFLVQYSEEWARGMGYKVIELHARRSVEMFYKKLGYAKQGSEFSEVNIPHIKMSKTI